MENTVRNSNWLSASADGGDISLSTTKNGQISVSYSTNGQKEGYYTAYLHQTTPVVLKNETMAVVTLSTNDETWMNLLLVDENQNTVTCEDGTSIYLKENETDVYEQTDVTNGVIQIPAGFEGTVYFPIQQGKKGHELKSTVTAGFITVLPQDAKTEYTVSDFKLGNKAEFIAKGELLVIEGERSIEIPVKGEYTYRYTVKNGSNVAFSLASEADSAENQSLGVSITADGVLTVSQKAKEQSISLQCTNENGTTYKYQVTLTESWFRSEEATEYQMYVVPDQSSIYSYQKQISDWQRVKDIAPAGVAAAFVILAGYFAFYRFVIRKR